MLAINRNYCALWLLGFVLSWRGQVSGFIPSSLSTNRVLSYQFPLLRYVRQVSRQDETGPKKSRRIILDPFPAAADPDYPVVAPVGRNSFIVSRGGEPTTEELSDDNIFRVIDGNVSDLEVNTLVWKCLGYRFEARAWHNGEVFPKWKQKYPTPPDLIGMQRIYTKEVDQPIFESNRALVRSIPTGTEKNYLKKFLGKYGFTGYKVEVLTPNLTRRAQCANWLLYFRENLFGYSVDELRHRRELSRDGEENSKS